MNIFNPAQDVGLCQHAICKSFPINPTLYSILQDVLRFYRPLGRARLVRPKQSQDNQFRANDASLTIEISIGMLAVRRHTTMTAIADSGMP
jgi:hypothetical protein